MTIRLPDLVGRIRLDTRELDRGKGQVASFGKSLATVGEGSKLGAGLGDLDRALGRLDSSIGKVGDNLTDFGTRASIGATLPIAAGLGLATKAASDLSEQVNKTKVVFGDAADGVLSFSEESAQALGQSQRAALEAAGTYGNLFSAIGLTTAKSAEMSKALLTLGADLASFNNANPEDVFLALRAGLSGESEPLKKFGVNLNETTLKAKALELGLADGVGVLNASAKAQAAYALILEQTSTAQGDFARTSGGLANQTRILRAEMEDAGAEIGAQLIPIALKLTSVASGLIDTFDSLPDAAQNLSLIGLSAVAAVGPLSFLAGNALKVKAAVSSATAAIGAQSFGAGVAAASATNLAGGLLKVAGVAGGLFAVTQGLQAIGGSADDASVNVKKLVAASGEQLVAVFKESLAFDPAVADKAFALVLASSTSEAQRLVDALKAAGAETADYQRAINAAIETDGKAAVAKEKDAAATNRAADAMRGAGESAKIGSAGVAGLAEATEDLAGSSKRVVDILAAVAKATDDRRRAVLSVVEAEQANRRAIVSFAAAVDDVRGKERDLADARRQRGDATRDVIGIERALNSVEDAQSSIVDSERALADARAGRGAGARAIADAEKELARAREDAAGAHGLKEAKKAGEGVADAEERLRRAREDGGQEEDIRSATEALSRAQLDAREAALSLADAREAGAIRVKAAEDALAASQAAALSAALSQARTFQDLAEQRAQAAGMPLSVAESYDVFRNKLIELKDGAVGPLRTSLEGVVNQVAELPSEKKITFSVPGLEEAITMAGRLATTIGGIRSDVDFIAGLSAALPSLKAPSLPALPTLIGVGGRTAADAGLSQPSTSTSTTTINTTVVAPGVNADVAREIDKVTARAAARAR